MEKLTVQEEEAMMVIWKIGEADVKAVLNNMDKKIPYTTLASTIKKLENKKYLTSRLIGNSYLYRPIVRETVYKNEFMKKVVIQHFRNSYKSLVSFFVEQEAITTRELKDIINLIESGKK